MTHLLNTKQVPTKWIKKKKKKKKSFHQYYTVTKETKICSSLVLIGSRQTNTKLQKADNKFINQQTNQYKTRVLFMDLSSLLGIGKRLSTCVMLLSIICHVFHMPGNLCKWDFKMGKHAKKSPERTCLLKYY